MAVAAIAIWGGRQESSKAFLNGRKNLGSVGFATSVSIGWIDVSIFATIGGIAFVYGWGVMWFNIGLFLGLFLLRIATPYIKRVVEEHNVKTLADFYAYEIGQKAGIAAGLVSFIYLTLWSLSLFVIGGKALSFISDLTYQQAIILVGLVTGLYLILGGFNVVLKTDFFQYSLLLLIGVVLLFPVDSIEWQWQAYELKSFLSPNLFWIVSITLSVCFGVLCWADVWARMIAGTTEKTVKRGLLLTSLGFVVPSIFFIIIVGTVQFYSPESNSELAILNGLKNYAHPVLMPLVIVIVLSVLMSSLDTTIFGASLVFVNDLLLKFKYLKKYNANKSLVRGGIIAIVLFDVIVALRTSVSGYELLFFAMSSSVCLAPVALVTLFHIVKISDFTAFCSVVVGLLFFSIGVLSGYMTVDNTIIPFFVSSGVLLLFFAVEKVNGYKSRISFME